MNRRRSRRLLSSIFLVSLAVWVLVLEFGLSTYLNHQRAKLSSASVEQANSVRILIETEINIAAFLANGIESYIIAHEGQVKMVEMGKILALIYQRGPYFRNIGIAPDNQVSLVYPLEGNESVLGFRYEDNPSQWPVVKKIMDSRQGILAGPLTLVQGGTGLIYRSPVFVGDTYWGLLSSVIDADRIFNLVRQHQDPTMKISIRGRDARGAEGDVFFGDPQLFNEVQNFLSISVPGGEWQLAFKKDWLSKTEVRQLYLFFFLLAVLPAWISSALVRAWLNRNLLSSLKDQVEVRTHELKQSNALLQSVLSSAESFAIIAMTPEGIITLFNSGAEIMLGYGHDELIDRASFASFFYRHQTERKLFEQLEAQPVIAMDTVYKHKDGEQIDVQLVMSRIMNDVGHLEGYLAIAEDIRERNRIEQMKSEFISTVSHELRTPLTAISGSLGLIKGGVAGTMPEAMSAMLDLAFKNSQRLNLLINDLLDMEKLVAGKMEFDLQTYSVCDLLQQALESNHGYAAQFQVQLTLVACDSQLQINVDAMRFAQIMSNLLSNAVKFSESAPVVEVAAVGHENNVRISVRDFGQGIPEAFHHRIFQKFSQADSSDTRQKGGTGLGLAITRELVERMQGEIGFETSSAGTEFYIIFERVPHAD